MKKLLTLSIGALLALPAVARDFTYTYEGNTVTYTVIDETAKTCKTKEGVKNEYGFYESGHGNDVNRNLDLKLPEHPMDGSKEYTLTEIGGGSFIWNNIESVAIPNTVYIIGEGAFSGCPNLMNVVIQASVTNIENYAFEGCERLTVVDIIGSGLEEIGEHAFALCGKKNIENGIPFQINLPQSLRIIGNSAFIESALKVIALPDNVDIIWHEAFADCPLLESVTIPKYPALGSYIWHNCPNLRDIYYLETDPFQGPASAPDNNFDESVYETATLHVAKGMIPTFKKVEPWKLFAKIVDGTTGISDVDADVESAQPGEIFNLNGVKVSSDTNALAPGLYIVRKGDSVKKISIK